MARASSCVCLIKTRAAASAKFPPEPMAAYAAGTLLIARENFLRVGLFDEAFRAGEFMDWHARATDLGLKSYLLPEVVSMRRVHGANHTVRTEKVPSSYAAVLKATLDRRRAAAKGQGNT